jgi:hypothetical protein
VNGQVVDIGFYSTKVLSPEKQPTYVPNAYFTNQVTSRVSPRAPVCEVASPHWFAFDSQAQMRTMCDERKENVFCTALDAQVMLRTPLLPPIFGKMECGFLLFQTKCDQPAARKRESDVGSFSLSAFLSREETLLQIAS